MLNDPPIDVPAAPHPTHPRVAYLIDLGSDGRIRRYALVESSGDPAVDAAAGKAVAATRFAPPTVRCISVSTVVRRYWDVPVEPPEPPASADISSPAPAPSASPTATALSCAALFVRPTNFPIPPRKPPGTTAIDVGLDALARVTAVHLVRSSGNKKTDYAATIAARHGRYRFELQPGCAPAPTTYRLEMTFH